MTEKQLNTNANQVRLAELKEKKPVELLGIAEEHEIDNASTLRKQELLFAILKRLAEKDITIIGDGVVEVLQDGFGFIRSPDANYCLLYTSDAADE